MVINVNLRTKCVEKLHLHIHDQKVGSGLVRLVSKVEFTAHVGYTVFLQQTERVKQVTERLRSFNACNIMLRMFYQSVVASSIFFAVVCWGSRLRAADANKISRIIRETGSVLGVQLDSLVMVSERRMLGKLHSILDNNTHPLHQVLTSTRSAPGGEHPVLHRTPHEVFSSCGHQTIQHTVP